MDSIYIGKELCFTAHFFSNSTELRSTDTEIGSNMILGYQLFCFWEFFLKNQIFSDNFSIVLKGIFVTIQSVKACWGKRFGCPVIKET